MRPVLHDRVVVVETGRGEQARLQPMEPTDDGSRWRLILMPDTGVTAASRIRWQGMVLSVSGEVMLHTDHRGRPQRREVTVTKARALPDVGVLRRAGAGTAGHFDPDTKTWVPAATPTLWSGPCLVAADNTGTPTEVGEQMVSVQPFTIEVPLSVTDVRPDDEFLVTSSTDTRLIGRRLVVTRIEAGTEARTRVIHAVDDQG